MRCGSNKCNFVEKTFAECRNFAPKSASAIALFMTEKCSKKHSRAHSGTNRQLYFLLIRRLCECERVMLCESEFGRGGRLAGACVGAVSQINKRLRSFECALVLNFSAQDYLHCVKLLPFECSSAVDASFQSLHFFQLCIFFFLPRRREYSCGDVSMIRNSEWLILKF